MSYPEPLAPRKRPVKKQPSCLGFLGWAVALLVGFAVIVVGGILLLRHSNDDSNYSKLVGLQSLKTEPGYHSPRFTTPMSYSYAFDGKTYAFSGRVTALEARAHYACVDPKSPQKHILLNTASTGHKECGDKHLSNPVRTATATP